MADEKTPRAKVKRKYEQGKYSRTSRRVWLDDAFRRASPMAPSGQALWLYLLTTHHQGPIPGLFALRQETVAGDLRWPLKAVREKFAEIHAAGLAVEVDWDAGLVWLPNAVKHNSPANPNQVKGWRATLVDGLPDCPLRTRALAAIRQQLAEVLERPEPILSAFDAVLAETVGGTVPGTVSVTVAATVPETVRGTVPETTTHDARRTKHEPVTASPSDAPSGASPPEASPPSIAPEPERNPVASDACEPAKLDLVGQVEHPPGPEKPKRERKPSWQQQQREDLRAMRAEKLGPGMAPDADFAPAALNAKFADLAKAASDCGTGVPAAYAAFLADPFWGTKDPPWPLTAFVAQFAKYASSAKRGPPGQLDVRRGRVAAEEMDPELMAMTDQEWTHGTAGKHGG